MNKQMLQFVKFSIFLYLIIISFSACKKEDPVLPSQQQIEGLDGSTILSGMGAPTSSLGKVGDFYLNKEDATLYGPKTASGWGDTSLSLKGDKGDTGENGTNGANGTNGTDGSKMLSGFGIPPISIGVIGDFYFDKENIAIYGPKTGSSWGDAVSLKAPTADGVKVVLIKNHSFQSVIRNAEYDLINQNSLEANIAEKAIIENEMSNAQNQYNQQIAYYENLYQNNQISQSDYNSAIAQTNQIFNIAKANYEQEKVVNATEKARIEEVLALGSFDVSSAIAIDAKYHAYYDEGLVTAYIRNAKEANGKWISTEGINLYQTANSSSSLNTWISDLNKDLLTLKGVSYYVNETDVKAARVEIKLVFIPASSVEIIAQNKVNIHNYQELSQLLGL